MKDLNNIPIGQHLRIQRIDNPLAPPDLCQHLQQLGFLPGEEIVVQRRARPGNDPLIVRVGSCTFAMRKFEAACIQVEVSHG